MIKEIKEAQKVIRARMAELEPQIGDAVWLQEELSIINEAIKVRDDLSAKLEKLKPPATAENLKAWALMHDPDQQLNAPMLVQHFGISGQWARVKIKELAKLGILEPWGRKGYYRRVPERSGEPVKLSVVTR